MARPRSNLLQISAVVCFVAGCSSRPAAIEPAYIDPGSASAQAMEQYDKNGDGALDEAELAAVPGIEKHKEKYDSDGDGRVSEKEIAGRLEVIEDQAVGIRSLRVVVQLDRRPLRGATVRFVPESYLGDALKVATGVTDTRGGTKVSVKMEDLPEALKQARMGGIFAGTYRIEVTHAKIDVPSKYNVKTTLGEEIARDTVGERVVLELTTK